MRFALRACLCWSVCAALLLAVQFAASNEAQAQTVTVHGVVTNAATGQGVPRALVRVEGDADAGALTDGDGHFEIPGIHTGPQSIEVTKPGFRDRPRGAAAGSATETAGAHSVIVSAQMPDLVFTLEPTSSIHGQVELSTGDVAQGIELKLLRRTVEDGRADWTLAATTRTDSEGAYRFASLANGVYVLYTEPALDTEPATSWMEAGGSGRPGFASIFYPDARDLAGAARIRLSQGEQASANLTLTIEPFQLVSVSVSLPQEFAGWAGADFSAQVMDASGHQLPYRAGYSQQAHTVQVLLPDGTYSIIVSCNPHITRRLSGGEDPDSGTMVGSVDFSVSGREVPPLRVQLSLPHQNPVELRIERSGLAQSQSQTSGALTGRGTINVLLSQSGDQNGSWIGAGTVNLYASGFQPGQMETRYLPPGVYWAHTNIGQNGLCEQSLTAGGINLALEPLSIGPSGSSTAMTLTVRDDCASPTLSLPESWMNRTAGYEPFFTVYAVPDFDFTRDLQPVILRPSTGGTYTLENLTPGSYHVYALSAAANLEYRNPAALASLPNPGQPVTLSAGTTTNLVLEMPEK
jgi:hypothetical protein